MSGKPTMVLACAWGSGVVLLRIELVYCVFYTVWRFCFGRDAQIRKNVIFLEKKSCFFDPSVLSYTHQTNGGYGPEVQKISNYLIRRKILWHVFS